MGMLESPSDDEDECSGGRSKGVVVDLPGWSFWWCRCSPRRCCSWLHSYIPTRSALSFD